MRRFTRWILAATTLALSPALALAQAAAFPSKPMKILVPFTAGSGADSSSRFYGEQLSKMLNQTVTVENKPGGSGVIAVQAVRQAPADGHTILMGSNSPAVVNAITIKNLPYDPFKDLRPLYGLAISPVAFAVRADSPHKTIQDVVAAAKKENRPLQLGNYSAGYQLVAAWLGTASGLPVTHIPYKGAAGAITDTLSGQVQFTFTSMPSVIGHLKAGSLRAVAVTSGRRAALLKDVPTIAESGFPGFDVTPWFGVLGPAGIPEPLVARINGDINRLLGSRDTVDRFAAQGAEPLVTTPAQFGRIIASDVALWSRIVRDTGATVD
jgi:tripartite-type tricarboxylate transporter receptor subunit TctC